MKRALPRRTRHSSSTAVLKSGEETAKKVKREVSHATNTSQISKGKKKGTGSANLSWFLRVYRGLGDWHLPIFKEVENFTHAKHVLYPGSDKHFTVSLVFASVVYVDYNKKVSDVFKDAKVLEWVNENKFYKDETKLKFLCKSFESKFETLASFDLLISASAGIVSTSCAKYLKVGGYILVSDAHYDARKVYTSKEFEFIAVCDDGVDTSDFTKEGHFTTTTNGRPITKAQVEESIAKPKKKRSFKLKKEGMFYLFRKIK